MERNNQMKRVLIYGMNYFHYINSTLHALNSLGHIAKISYVKPFEKEGILSNLVVVALPFVWLLLSRFCG